MKQKTTKKQINTAKGIITDCLKNHTTISFGKAAIQLEIIKPGEKFLGSLCQPIINIFNKAMKGSDALLVDRNGKYATRPETENHPNWLKEHGYTIIPPFKPAKEKTVKEVTEAITVTLSKEQYIHLMTQL